jgi:hypothetical protein
MIPPLMSCVTFFIFMIASLEELRTFQPSCSFTELDGRSDENPKVAYINVHYHPDSTFHSLLEIKAT